MNILKSFFQYSLQEMEELFIELDEKPIHGETVFQAVYQNNWRGEEIIEGISKSLYEKIKNFDFSIPEIIDIQVSKDGTKKYLIALEDKNIIEAVLLKYEHGNTLCLSTQKGCAMGCTFCASSNIPFYGNLLAKEIVGQYLAIVKKENINIRNIVYMGIGEPLNNPDEVYRSLKIFTEEKGIAIAPRHISLSTCGLAPEIRRMADENWPCRLALSLHYTNDELRSKYMPINNLYNIEELLKACKYYVEKTDYLIFIEYALINNVNNSVDDAEKLAYLLKDINSRVNLIGLNPINNENFEKDNHRQFIKVLRDEGIFATYRRSLGGDIDGACGQLRAKNLEEK